VNVRAEFFLLVDLGGIILPRESGLKHAGELYETSTESSSGAILPVSISGSLAAFKAPRAALV
jgi:hypothetical protein